MVLDLLLAASLLLTAWRSLYANDPLQAVGLFVAYGLLLALAWARLDALYVALAEAGIGAGLIAEDLPGHLPNLLKELEVFSKLELFQKFSFNRKN